MQFISMLRKILLGKLSSLKPGSTLGEKGQLPRRRSQGVRHASAWEANLKIIKTL